MSGSIFFIVIILIIIAIIFLMVTGKKQGKVSDKKREITELHVDVVEKKRMKEPVREDPLVTAAKKELYQYVNQSVKKMFQMYRKNKWDSLTELGAPSEEILEYYDKILETLNERTKKLIEDLFSCIYLETTEENTIGQICDSDHLQDVFLGMMVPFYPVYYKELGAIRYSALLNQKTLELFRSLTGKKFKMGYKNRYASGVSSYEWKGDYFQVYDAKGHLLCDARFAEGKIKDGYAEQKVEELSGKLWDVIQKGTWKDGEYVDGVIAYHYKKPCE